MKMLIGVLINYSNRTLSREVFSLVQMTLSICVSSSNCSRPSLACGQCYTRKTLWATSSFALLVTFSFNFSFSVAPSNSVVSHKQHVPRELNRKDEHTETDRDFFCHAEGRARLCRAVPSDWGPAPPGPRSCPGVGSSSSPLRPGVWSSALVVLARLLRRARGRTIRCAQGLPAQSAPPLSLRLCPLHN